MPRVDYEKLLQNVSIEDVATRLGMTLKKIGDNQSRALCPFHDDKTPSLLIDSNRSKGRQHFYCFACGAHGDAIDLVKEQLHIGFKDAVEWLMPRNSTSPKNNRNQDIKKESPTSKVDQPGLQFGYNLYKEHSNDAALDSWIQSRNLDPSILKRAGFVYAPKNILSRIIENQPDRSTRREYAGDLEDALLIRKLYPGVSAEMHLPLDSGNEAANRYSDYFVGERIIFPLHDETGKILGLGARAIGNLKGSATPKYQFTKDFPKSTILYRSNFAFKLIQSEAKKGKKNIALYICEGFLDALQFERIGIPAVAIMGSSISEKQIQLIRSLDDSLSRGATLTVVVSFDRDEAGLRGAAAACLKLMQAGIECAFLWPTNLKLQEHGVTGADNKDPDEYLSYCTTKVANDLLSASTFPPETAVLSYAFSTTAEETFNNDLWVSSSRSRKIRAFNQTANQIEKIHGSNTISFLCQSISNFKFVKDYAALAEWEKFLHDSTTEKYKSYSEEFLNNAEARLNHSRMLAYMGSRRGELPCDEPRWERLDIAATAFNSLLTDALSGNETNGPIGAYNAVWVPRSFGGSEYRLKIMPLPEDLIIQQYLLNEILTERWDHESFSKLPFSREIPAVRYYREDRRTITTGFDSNGDGTRGEFSSRPLSYAYQIDMDVLEGRQPATDQGMYRPFPECWRHFMTSLSEQATEIGYVHSIRLDAKRYYDKLRRYIVRDRLLTPLQSAISSVTDDTPEFAKLLRLEGDKSTAAIKAASVLDRLDEHLFGVSYARPDTGLTAKTDELMGIPQGPVLSAWIGSIALFPVDEEAHRFMARLNIDRPRVGYARYVDDIVLLADDPIVLAEMREAIDKCARKLELVLLAKADEIPAMTAEEFVSYINKGRALAAYGPAWEPPLIGDGESGWEFWSVAPATDRQSALQLLHNVELYKASSSTLIKTVKTAFQAPDLRASELPKAARLIWYALAVDNLGSFEREAVLAEYIEAWNGCMQSTAWKLCPDDNEWESPVLFALEGLEHLIDKQSRDIAELSSEENSKRRQRIIWLAELVLTPEFDSYVFGNSSGPRHQLDVRLSLIRWKAERLLGRRGGAKTQLAAERSKPVQNWHPFEWMHKAIALLSETEHSGEDPLLPLVGPTQDQKRKNKMSGFASDIFSAFLPCSEDDNSVSTSNTEPLHTSIGLTIALQTIVSIVPKEHLPLCLSRRPHLIWKTTTDNAQNRLILPPLPGITTSKLFSCTGTLSSDGTSLSFGSIEVLTFSSPANNPDFFGSDSITLHRIPTSTWSPESLTESIVRYKTNLTSNIKLSLQVQVPPVALEVTAETLNKAAKLYRAIAQVVSTHSDTHEAQELVPAWPYIAADINNQFYYLVTESVARDELGNIAFVRDGGRALRTAEIPIYEAGLWRVGVAISDYLGLYDDFAKFHTPDSDLTLDATAIANPARYVLRTQLRKLRGSYANSQISKRRGNDGLPATVSRALRLLETFPEETADPLDQLLYVLTAEAESAGMYLAFLERQPIKQPSSFLRDLANRVLSRLPLSIGQTLATGIEKDNELRRDFAGPLCFARKLLAVSPEAAVAEFPAWKALRAGLVSTAIFSAFAGLIASLRNHGSFERYENFDFPEDWGIPAEKLETDAPNSNSDLLEQSNYRDSLIEQCRLLVQHLGHRINQNTSEHISSPLRSKLESIAKKLAAIDYQDEDAAVSFEWPFEKINEHCFNSLNLELLDSVELLVKSIDEELGFETVLVVEQSYGYNPQTKRFTDSRSGVQEVTPWMISQFPRFARHIEEILHQDRFLRVWTEVFDRSSGKLLSVSVLGEPFASIAINKPNLEPVTSETLGATQNQEEHIFEKTSTTETSSLRIGIIKPPTSIKSDTLVEPPFSNGTKSSPSNSSTNETTDPDKSLSHTDWSRTSIEGGTHRDSNEFRKRQNDQWYSRGEHSKPKGLVRIALLQADFDLTYKHPFVEACPTQWPFDSKTKDAISLKYCADIDSKYWSLMKAAKNSTSGHCWESTETFPSWSEHRRRSILRRTIDTCKIFGVDLLILPEYSVRRETIDWIKSYIANSSLSVLAGTYLNFSSDPEENNLAAPLTLLWPVPKPVSDVFITSLQKKDLGSSRDYDALQRGHVIEFSRNKKYRSIALEEFFRPPFGELKPLFKLGDLSKKLEAKIGFEPSADVITQLLANTRLPLKYFLELICSEAFLVSSPANYHHMGEDLIALRRKFGDASIKGEVLSDIEHLAKYLSITGDGIDARRSILAVPSATSRSADYWFAGQANFLAAGTTTVFCNSIDGKSLVGGSCFIGRGSWKSEDTALGYISKLTPYHGWSKGIYYNNKDDALSKNDQALVIADLDPHNMLEGKPRAQTMPSPLQLVAYLPLIETINWACTQSNLLRSLSLSVPNSFSSSKEKVKNRPSDETEFWKLVGHVKTRFDEESLKDLWKTFPDVQAITSRADAYQNNCDMQPSASIGPRDIFSSPALYDWLDVSLTLTEQRELPTITVHPWKNPNI